MLRPTSHLFSCSSSVHLNHMYGIPSAVLNWMVKLLSIANSVPSRGTATEYAFTLSLITSIRIVLPRRAAMPVRKVTFPTRFLQPTSSRQLMLGFVFSTRRSRSASSRICRPLMNARFCSFANSLILGQGKPIGNSRASRDSFRFHRSFTSDSLSAAAFSWTCCRAPRDCLCCRCNVWSRVLCPPVAVSPAPLLSRSLMRVQVYRLQPGFGQNPRVLSASLVLRNCPFPPPKFLQAIALLRCLFSGSSTC
mmetsp:Transcript_73/g.204  ORF Transcript_73/g.204 Transcript_73/m.204 type:complete len:250 (+) Transcript_73:2733-3482(+)